MLDIPVVSFNAEISPVSVKDRPGKGAAEDHLVAGHW
jgi:hypothetical protein